MKNRFHPLFQIAAVLTLAIPAHAVSFFWNGTDTTADADGGTGAWDTTLTNWDDLATGGNSIAWPTTGTDNDAVFGGTAGTVTVDEGGVTANDLTFTTAGYIIQDGQITLNGTTPTITNSVDATIHSILDGSAGLTKTGAGILTLGGANLYTGTTAINAGTLQITHASALGNTAGGTTVSSGATLALSGGLLVGAEALNLNGTGVGGLGAIRSISGTNSMSGAVTLAGATRIGVEANTLEISGAFSGTQALTTVGAGKLILSGGGTLGQVIVGNQSVAAGGHLEWKNGTGTTAGAYFGVGDNVSAQFTMSGGSLTASPTTSLFVGSFSTSGVTGTMNVTGGTFTMGNNLAIYVGGGGYNGNVSGNGVLNISNGTFSTGTTTGTFRMGANATGQTGNGEINLSGTGILETARSITKGTRGTATVNFDGGTYKLRAAQATMFGTGVVTNVKAGGAVIDTNAFDGTIGTVLAAGSPSGGFTKLGAGVLTLNGNNSYTGGTTVTAGVIALGNAGALGTTGTITMNGGTLRFSAANTTDYSSRILLADGKTAGFDTNSQNVTFATAFQVGTLETAALNKTGAGTLTLSDNNTYTGGTTVTAGVLALGNSGALGTTGTITMNGGTLRFSAANTNDYSSRIQLADGKTAVFDTNGESVSFATALQVGTLKTAVLNKTGAGTLTLGAANTHTGGTSIAGSSGVVSAIRISNGSALGTGTLTIGSGGNTDQSRLELTGGIAVSNAVTAMTSRNNFIPSILNVSGNNSMSANLSSGGGGARITFQSDSDRLTLSGSVGVRNPLFTGSGDFLVSGNITSPSSYQTLTKEGAGTLILSGASNTTATLTTITAGVLQIGNGGASGTLGTAPVTNNATLVFNRSDSFSVANVISGSGALTKQGAGTLTLDETNAYTGVTTLSAGTISVAALGDGGVSGNLGAATSDAANLVFGGGTLQISAAGTASSNRGFTINGASSATFNVSNATGALTLTGSAPTTTGVLYKTGVGSLTLDPGEASQSLGALSANGGELILKSGTYATTAKDASQNAYNIGAGARGGILTIDGATLNVGGSNNLKIAAAANGSLNIKSGTVTSNDLVIGHNGIGSGSQSGGSVTVTNVYHQDGGAGSSYTLSGGDLTARRIYNNTAGAHDFTLNLNGGTLNSASDTTNLIDNNNTGSQVSVLLGTGNTIINTTASNASIVRPMGDMPTVAGTFTKAGENTLTLTAANTYTGATRITGGTLALTGDGSIASSSIIVGANTTFDVSGVTDGFALASGQEISGPGSVTGAMEVSGTLSPGRSPGTLTTGTQTWLNGGNYNWQVLDAAGVAGGGYDTIAITGTLDLSDLTAGGFHINLWSLASTGPDVNGNALNFLATNSYSWTLASASSEITGFDAANFSINVGAFNGTSGFSNDVDGGEFSISQSGNNLVLNFTAVPEPGAALLGGLGLLTLLRRRR